MSLITTTEIADRLRAQARAKGNLGTAHWTNGTVSACATPVHGRSSSMQTFSVRWCINGNPASAKAAATFLNS